jgi:uncharacterized protein YggE
VGPGVATGGGDASAAAPKREPTPVETGRVQVSASVAVVFVLGPA